MYTEELNFEIRNSNHKNHKNFLLTPPLLGTTKPPPLCAPSSAGHHPLTDENTSVPHWSRGIVNLFPSLPLSRALPLLRSLLHLLLSAAAGVPKVDAKARQFSLTTSLCFPCCVILHPLLFFFCFQ
ncbi:hypothetical protein BVRB_8g201830 [Beta vulgaris subsp. vulgaris]|uniref:Uncharacterized protein n=1 Tax=Beta vulgaris subsp. vulgaris TaxID=3555 RepID=A0A0J8B9P9_BETVV|nr:hypothetical protein BVRB_8g201830 [Beta vulgaris subsp. vulgaris]